MVVVCVCFVVIADWMLLFWFGLNAGLWLLIWLFDDWLVVPIVVCLLLCLLIWCFGCMFGGCGGFGGLLGCWYLRDFPGFAVGDFVG